MARSTAAATNVNGDGTESVLGRGTRVRGRVRGDGDLRIEGAVEGDVAISGDLAIEEGATIKGDVQASTVTIGGELAGDVTARGGGGAVTTGRTVYAIASESSHLRALRQVSQPA